MQEADWEEEEEEDEGVSSPRSVPNTSESLADVTLHLGAIGKIERS